jgi:hypothetical protein
MAIHRIMVRQRRLFFWFVMNYELVPEEIVVRPVVGGSTTFAAKSFAIKFTASF